MKWSHEFMQHESPVDSLSWDHHGDSLKNATHAMQLHSHNHPITNELQDKL